ncbi:MAG: alpha/beta hydrolase [Cyanobacteria bacterium P01_F01_bin.86]
MRHFRLFRVLLGALFSFGLLGCGLTRISQEHVSKHWQSIEYANESPSQNLDVFLPQTGDPPYPTILYIHGGGFMAGNKYGDANAIAQAALLQGYAFVTIDYRLSGEALFPAAVNDALDAVRFLKANADAHKIDANRIAVWGSSAGGNLAAMVATKGSAQDGTDVRAAVNWFGPIEFDTMDAQFAQLGLKPKMGKTSSASSPESKYLGVTVGTDAAAGLVTDANPATYIDSSDPPMFIQHGSADAHIPYLQSKNFAAKLAAAIGNENVVFELLAGAGHGGQEFENAENTAKIFAWLKQHLDE